MNDSTRLEVEENLNGGKMVSPLSSSTSSIDDPNGQTVDNPGTGESKATTGEQPSPHHAVAEFLYQLTKMLEDNNEEIIEWSQGRIKVHYPGRLEGEVLHKYFRHSKFASFQRQLNYFGFRKIAGKGKMAPCSYVNEACTSDIKSLLKIKRKTNGSAARKAALNRAMEAERMQAAGSFGALGMTTHLRSDMMDLMSKALSAGYHPGAALLSQQLQAQPFYSDPALAAFAAGQNRQSASDFARFTSNSTLGMLEQQQQQQLLSQLGAMSSMAQAQARNSSFAQQASAQAPAMASVMPATAAMNAAAAASKSNNLFESTPNLKSLVNEQQQQASQAKRIVNGSLSNRVASQNLLNRLPSSGTIFPDNLSTASLSQLLQSNAMQNNALSSNRLSSMLSLSGYLSREPSLVDLLLAAPGTNVGQFPPGMALAARPPAGDGKRHGN
jgi:hypothetical protein